MENNEKTTLKQKLSDTYAKIKKIKNIEIIICIILIAAVLIIYGIVKKAQSNNESGAGATAAAVSVEKSQADLLSEVLGKISGAGNVSVFISYDGSEQTVYAYDSTVNTVVREDNSGGETITTTETVETSVPVFVKVNGVDTPLVERVLNPKILGVVIVAEGADDISVRLRILSAAATALQVDEKIIEIFIMN